MTKKENFIRANDIVILENNIIGLIFDKGTGSINSIINKIYDVDLISYKEHTQLFRIVYAIKDYRGHYFDSEKQEVDSFSISRDKDVQTALISYKILRSSEGLFHVSVKVRIDLADSNDEAHMKIEVQNNDNGEITQVWFPWVRGITVLGDDPDKDVLAYPNFGGSLVPNPMNYFPKRGMFVDFHEWTRNMSKTILAQPYPGWSSMQWMNIGCDKHGLYMACLNKNGDFLLPRVQKHLWDKEEHLSLAMVKYPYIKKDESWISPTYVLSPHKGDWHVAADKYRNWLETWLPKREKANWAKYTNGFYHFIIRHQDGTIINRIEEIPEILSEAKDHGINLLFVCGWYESGHNGDQELNYNPYNPYELKKAFKIVHEAGGHLLLYLNSHAYSMNNPNFENEGFKWASKSYDGLPLTESWGWAIPHYPSFEAVTWSKECPSAKGWQEMLAEKMESAAELGADCGLFDELHDVYLCHDTNHGHKRPESAFGSGVLEMLQMAFKKGRKINQYFELASEGVVDVFTPYIAIFHSRVDAVTTGYSNPEIIRYTLPWVTGITGGFLDMGLKNKLYQSFLLGLPLDVEIHTHNRGRFNFDPELAVEIKRVNMLRNKHKDLLVDGEFRDTVGLEIIGKKITAKLFRGKGSVLLTLWNQGKKTSRIRLILNLSNISFESTTPKAFLHRGLIGEEPSQLLVKCEKGKIFVNVPYLEADDIALIRLTDN